MNNKIIKTNTNIKKTGDLENTILENNFMNKMSVLPMDVINQIKEYCNPDIFIFSNKDNFYRYFTKYRFKMIIADNKSLYEYFTEMLHNTNNTNNSKNSKNFYLNRKASLVNITRENYTIDSYVRMIIRRRHDFIFKTIIDAKHEHWFKTKKYIYHGNRFDNYMEYLKYICDANDSEKCKNIVKYYIKKISKTRKKKHKKIRSINNRWSN